MPRWLSILLFVALIGAGPAEFRVSRTRLHSLATNETPFKNLFMIAAHSEGPLPAIAIASPDGNFAVRIGPHSYGPFDEAAESATYSEDGSRWALPLAFRKSRYILLSSGRLLGPYPGLDESSLVANRDGSRWAFRVIRPDGVRLSIDGEKEYGPYREIRYFHPGLEGSPPRFAVRVVKPDGHSYALVNGREHGPYQFIDFPELAVDGGEGYGFAARRDGRMFLVLSDGREFGPYREAWSPLVDGSGKRFAAIVKKENGYFYIVEDGKKESGPFLDADFLTTPSGRFRYAYRARRTDASVVVRFDDGTELGPYGECDFLILYGDAGYAFRYRDAEDRTFVQFGPKKRLGPYLDCGKPAVSADGQRIGFFAERESGWYAVLGEGQEYGPFSGSVREREVIFSASGSAWAFSAAREDGEYIFGSSVAASGPWRTGALVAVSPAGWPLAAVSGPEGDFVLAGGKRFGPGSYAPRPLGQGRELGWFWFTRQSGALWLESAR